MTTKGKCRCDVREAFTHLTIPITVCMYAAALDVETLAADRFPTDNVLGLSIDVERDSPHLIRIVNDADRHDDQWTRWAILFLGLAHNVPTWTGSNGRGVAYLMFFDAMWTHRLMPVGGDAFPKKDFLELISLSPDELAAWFPENLVERKVAAA